ncbi:hypothetical protein C8A01DRAFT_47909 [Parachaetomium inaequale]|uniref:Uncharacterized protein n=1 Tax=Parachaetomium inaequale TaxID=2588326 RepID=A0AAN6PDC9_9PEZI|nr:hypothetical protein C8A01DRAFT_47909 [Parachaetomium inaequale]
MVGLYDDPFAYDGTEFPAFLAQDSSQFASGSSPEDFHVHSATEPHFPSSVHAALKGHDHHQHPAYLSPTDHPLGSPTTLNHHHGLPPAHLPRSAPTSYPIPRSHQPLSRLDTMGLAWNSTTTSNPNQPSPPDPTAGGATTAEELRTLLATLQSDLRQTALERDEARMQLSTARNELYAARQTEKRLRVERDEARSQAEFLGGERVKLKQSESRLRRERNEARMAVLALKGKAGGGNQGKGGRKGAVVGMGGVESQGEESGESPPMGMEQG